MLGEVLLDVECVDAGLRATASSHLRELCGLCLHSLLQRQGAHPTAASIERNLRAARAALRAREAPLAAEKLAQDAFRTARTKLAQERAELAKTLADASARPSRDA